MGQPASELIEIVSLLRPAADPLDPARQQRMASAIARAVVETEAALAEPRFQLRRVSGRAVVASTPELAAYAGKLGEVADELAQADPLHPPLRVFQELFDITQPPLPEGGQPLNNERLLRLAAAMSTSAAVSAKQELYPRGMAAERALRLGLGALTGLGLGSHEQGFRACGIERLMEAPAWNIHLATGDSLLFGSRWTREGTKQGEQQFLGTEEESWAPEIYACEDREAISEVLGQPYHAVVGNPPYITVKDKGLNQAYRERYSTCHRQYSLAVPFMERFFDLAVSKAEGGRHPKDEGGRMKDEKDIHPSSLSLAAMSVRSRRIRS